MRPLLAHRKKRRNAATSVKRRAPRSTKIRRISWRMEKGTGRSWNGGAERSARK
jgi:hypothetical protein